MGKQKNAFKVEGLRTMKATYRLIEKRVETVLLALLFIALLVLLFYAEAW